MRAAAALAALLTLVLIGCAAPDMPPVSEPAHPPSKARIEAAAPGASSVEAPVAAPPPLASPPAPRRPGAYANTDPSDDFEVGPPEALADCDEQLKEAGVKWTAAKIPVHTEGKGTGASRVEHTCGSPQVVMFLRGPGKIAYEPAPVLTCKMALALASWEKIVTEEAQRTLRTRVVRIEQLGTYNCRVIPTAPGTMSEHGYANAIDIGRISLENGHTIDIYRDFDKGDDEPTSRNGAFLRAISRRANDEDVFSHVLTPFFDRAHDNHFHLDLARFRRDGTRPRR